MELEDLYTTEQLRNFIVNASIETGYDLDDGEILA